MPIATPEQYNEMLDRAKAGAFAYPAINVTSSQTLTAALQGFAEAESDGIIQVSVGGAEYWSGATVKDRVAGSLAAAAYAREVAKNYPVTIALHTDHCVKGNIDSWIRPLLEIEAAQVARGEDPTFQSHMCDWKIGRPVLSLRSLLAPSSGRTKPSSLSLGQWSVCRAMLTSKFLATSCA